MKRSSRVLAVSLPPDDAATFERLAADEGCNQSELFREMLRVYQAWRETQRFESLQRYGASQARQRGVKDERGVERLIEELRQG